ncbi:ComF family protein [Candidatus Saccharibacteria bacterium]|nr:ComF family protein [Candidatus Saccharibacteria bacterium]MBI3337938.1 ComF family protein [Candidatus Saccharibacteria bacterium]
MFKFERTQAVAPILAALTGESLPYLPENTLITHIPAATSRVRDRGYDQAKLLARYLAGSQGLPYVTVLARSGQARQVGSSRSVRLRQIEGVFRPVRGYLIKGAEVLLVDDVMTTGATLEEAARTLKKAGAKRVNAVVFAHKQ